MDVMKDRILDINPECEVELVKKLVTDDIDEILEQGKTCSGCKNK